MHGSSGSFYRLELAATKAYQAAAVLCFPLHAWVRGQCATSWPNHPCLGLPCWVQDALLDAAAAWVKPGGLLVYSTCSIEPEENEVRVRRFLAAHPEYSVEAPPASAGVPAECLTAEGFLQMLPHVHGTDGAFAARLRRRGA